jgi:Helix-loop-helix DNA-binding domain
MAPSPKPRPNPSTRREVHKISEQRRREQLKACFDQLFNLLPAYAHWPEGDRQPNRVEMLQKTLDYVQELKHTNEMLSRRIQELEK